MNMRGKRVIRDSQRNLLVSIIDLLVVFSSHSRLLQAEVTGRTASVADMYQQDGTVKIACINIMGRDELS